MFLSPANSVRKALGSTIVTRMPSGLTSSAIASRHPSKSNHNAQ
jgi:hypothetical protein